MNKTTHATRLPWQRIFALFAGVLPLLLLIWPTERSALAEPAPLTWLPLSSTSGGLEAPGLGAEQTAALVLDIDRDGVNDFVLAGRRTNGPSVVWYQRQANGWQRYLMEASGLQIEAGGAFADIDHDGDQDIVLGGDRRSNEVWWWENPSPNFAPNSGWVRRTIKNSGAGKHHDMIFGDFDGDGAEELVFWNQSAQRLMLAKIPADPRTTQLWPLSEIFAWSGGPELEGLAKGDIDGDGRMDIVGGGRWFKHEGGLTFSEHVIDNAQRFTRAAVGQLKPGGAPEVVFVAGDEVGPLTWYEFNGATWTSHILINAVDHGHSLAVADANQDSLLDIFVAEMRLDGGNGDAKLSLLLGDGNGNFTVTTVATGYDNHESRVADLDGDGDLDILGKPYNYGTPRVDVWLNQMGCSSAAGQWQRQVVDQSRPWRALFSLAADLDGDGRKDIVSGNAWYKNPGTAGAAWMRNAFAAPLNNAVAVYDFDGDGDLDVLGSAWQDNGGNPALAWARNEGSGAFTVLSNIPNGEGDFLQGVALGHFRSGGPLEVALSWHQKNRGVQMLTVPANPSTGQWAWRKISSVSQDEALSAGDIDRDGDLDLLQGTQWLRNDNPAAGVWTSVTLFATADRPDRNRLADINQDGRLDAVVGYEAISVAGKLAWYEQPVNPANPWTEHVIATVIGPMSLDVSDLDGDNDFDVVVGEHNLAASASPKLFTFTNQDSHGSAWQQSLVSAGDEHHSGAQAVDIDGDNDLDILSIGWSHNRTLLYTFQSQCAEPALPTATPVTPTELPTATPLPTPTATWLPTPALNPCSDGNGNLLNNSSLEAGSAEWSFFTDKKGAFTTAGPAFDCNAAARIEISQPGVNVQLFQTGFLLEPRTPYRLTFAAYSNSGHDLSLYVHAHKGTAHYGLSNRKVDLTTSWQTFSIEFTTQGFSKPTTNTRLRFWFAPFDGPADLFWIDAVRLEKLPSSTVSGPGETDPIDDEEVAQWGGLHGKTQLVGGEALSLATMTLVFADVHQPGVEHRFTVVSDSAGDYVVASIPVGDYLLSMEPPSGYLAPTALEIAITPDEVTEATLVLTSFTATNQLFLPLVIAQPE